MARESVHKKLEKVRPPRVHIEYQVNIGDAIVMKELPHMIGIIGDFSGKSLVDPGKVKDRKFVDIDRDSFNNVMSAMQPRAAFNVENRLQNNNSKLPVELIFNNINDFHPENVARQIPATKKLIEIRDLFTGLLTRVDGNQKAFDMLTNLLTDKEAAKDLRGQLDKVLELEGDTRNV